MSVRLEMLQVARLAPEVLGDAAKLVEDFLHGQQNPDGGFKDRAGRSDLYYTVFGVDGLRALRSGEDTVHLKCFLEGHGSGQDLDYVHLGCLARCWAALRERSPAPLPDGLACDMIERIEGFRARDGGYSPIPGSDQGTAYGAFVAMGTYQDLGLTLPRTDDLVGSLESLRTGDGAWANEHRIPVGATNATAAAVAVLRQLGRPVDASVRDWLLAQFHPQGGFKAAPMAPMPDLLSTATALHTLAGLEADLGPFKESCLDFIDSLWVNRGGFHGHWHEDRLDAEYTFYGLLALGHLSW